MSVDPFELLGLDGDATEADVQRARRRLAKEHHPDVGGDEAEMRRLNAAVTAAMVEIGRRADRRRVVPPAAPEWGRNDSTTGSTTMSTPGRQPVSGERDGRRVVHDNASFTIEALPAEAFEALLVVATWIGETLVDDPPYLLEVHLRDPVECWCRLDLVPDAGACTVSLTVATVEVGPMPDVDAVRDVWVAELNRLDWDGLREPDPRDRRPPS
ncbi:MAG: J domain-containing protein [Ilumatobacter sp.]|nr:MAG: J domain-containing protein [Ilumatobacter sp.]